jgi:hypothetical protein
MRLRGISAVGVLFVVGQIGFCGAYVWLKVRRAPSPVIHDEVSVVPSAVELGTIKVGSVRELRVAVTNHGKGVLNLLPPQTSCGCVKARLSTNEFGPGESGWLSFSFVAPENPQEVKRQIQLIGRDSGESWIVPIHANVDADVWCSPSSVRIEVTGGSGTKKATIHWADTCPELMMVSASKEIKVAQVAASAHVKVFDVTVSSKGQGEGALTVLEAASKRIVKSVGVRWSPKEAIELSPARFVVAPDDGKKTRTLFILSEAKKLKGPVIVNSLTPMVRILNTRALNECVTVATIEFDSSIVSKTRACDVVEVSIGGSNVRRVVRAELSEVQ